MAIIDKYKPDTEFYTDEGCYITELFNPHSNQDYSIARARVKPGVTTRLHKLRNTVERYIILEGSGLVQVGDSEPTTVEALDVVHIPADTPQKITNSSNSDLIFLCICSPSFSPNNYINLDK